MNVFGGDPIARRSMTTRNPTKFVAISKTSTTIKAIVATAALYLALGTVGYAYRNEPIIQRHLQSLKLASVNACQLLVAEAPGSCFELA